LFLSFLKTIAEKNPKGMNSIIFNKAAVDNPSPNKSKLNCTFPSNIEVVPKSPPIMPVIFKITRTVRIHANSHNMPSGLNSSFLLTKNFTPVNTQKTMNAVRIEQ